jgi:stage VI sporulation protein D
MEEEMRREERALAEQRQGLRFDIYERVRLSDEVKGIEQLDEIALIPQIQVVSLQEQAVLKGHLLLSGKFAGGEAARGTGVLEHAIPVEITLPMNRIPNLHDISVEIEQFDVDLIQPQTLNITGVLSLNGIRVLPASHEWKQQEEAEEVFVYRAPQDAADPTAAREETDDAVVREEADDAVAWAEPPAFPDGRDAEPAASPGGTAAFRGAERTEWAADADEPAAFLRTEQEQPSAAIREPVSAASSQVDAPDSAASRVEKPAEQPAEPPAEKPPVEAPAAEAPSPEEAKPEPADGKPPASESEAEGKENDGVSGEQESGKSGEPGGESEASGGQSAKPGAKPESPPKIAFAAKSRVEEKPAQLTSLIDSSEAQAVRRKAAEADAARAAEEQEARSVKEAAGWKSLFLSRETEETKFSSLRICIVQKEETIETIAERYRLHPNELAMYNRLSEPSVQEGQVIYIPK